MLDRLNLEKAEEARTVRLPDVCKEETGEDRKIVIRASAEGGSFCITVDNTYSGTLRYTRGDEPASTKHKGAGLGTAPSEALPNAAAWSAAWRQRTGCSMPRSIAVPMRPCSANKRRIYRNPTKIEGSALPRENNGGITMTINKTAAGETLTLTLSGRLDTNTSPRLEAELKQSVSGVKELIFDFSEVEYISSAGLRVLLAAQKVMNRQGSMKLVGVSPEVLEVFEITGFSDILTIE